MQRVKKTITIANTDTSGSIALQESGFVKTMTVNTPDTTNGTAITLFIKDPDGKKVYESNPMAEDSENLGTGLNIPVDIDYTIDLTFADPGATGGDVVIVLHIDTGGH